MSFMLIAVHLTLVTALLYQGHVKWLMVDTVALETVHWPVATLILDLGTCI